MLPKSKVRFRTTGEWLRPSAHLDTTSWNQRRSWIRPLLRTQSAHSFDKFRLFTLFAIHSWSSFAFEVPHHPIPIISGCSTSCNTTLAYGSSGSLPSGLLLRSRNSTNWVDERTPKETLWTSFNWIGHLTPLLRRTSGERHLSLATLSNGQIQPSLRNSVGINHTAEDPVNLP